MVYAGRSNLFIVYVFHLRQAGRASDSQRPDSFFTLLSVYRNVIRETVNTLPLAFLLSFVGFILSCVFL